MSTPDLPRPREAYSRLAAGLEPVLAGAGMRRSPRVNYPCWQRPSRTSETTIFLSLQVDRKATDAYSGGGFRIELERAREPIPTGGLYGRALFLQLLTQAEIATLLAHQNSVIRTLPHPPSEHADVYPAGGVREMYLSYFQPQQGFDAIRCWLRFRQADDLDRWTSTLEPVVGPLVKRADERLRPDVLHLGQGSLLDKTA